MTKSITLPKNAGSIELSCRQSGEPGGSRARVAVISAMPQAAASSARARQSTGPEMAMVIMGAWRQARAPGGAGHAASILSRVPQQMPARKAKPKPSSQAAAKKKSTPRPSAKAGSIGRGVAPQFNGITPKERLRMEKEEARWRAQDDLRALRAAEEVRRVSGLQGKARVVQSSPCQEYRKRQAFRCLLG